MDAFFIFHRRLGSDDETATFAERAEKLLFYASSLDDDLDVQLERLSVCEALIDLCQTLGATVPCDIVILDNAQYALYECEKDTWLVLCSTSALLDGDGKKKFVSSTFFREATEEISRDPSKAALFFMGLGNQKWYNKTRKLQDSGLFRKPGKLLFSKKKRKAADDDRRLGIDESYSRLLKAVLRKFYRLFVFLHGRLETLLKLDTGSGYQDSVAEQIKVVRKRLRKSKQALEFVSDDCNNIDSSVQELLEDRAKDEDDLGKLLLKSPADELRRVLLEFAPFFFDTVGFSSLNVLHDADAFPYFSVGKSVSIVIEQCMSHLSQVVSDTSHSMLLFKNRIIWTTLSTELTRLVYAYLNMLNETSNKTLEADRKDTENTIEAESDTSTSRFMNLGFPAARKPGEAKNDEILFFPRVFDIENDRVHRMAAYENGEAILVVLALDTMDSGDYDEENVPKQFDGLSKFANEELPNICQKMRTWARAAQNYRHQQSVASRAIPAMYSHTAIDNKNFSIVDFSREGADISSRTGLNSFAEDLFLYFNAEKSIVSISDAILSYLGNNIELQSVEPKEALAKEVGKFSDYPSIKTFGRLLPQSISLTIAIIRAHFETYQAEDMEITLFSPPSNSSGAGNWIAARKCLHRQVFLIVDGRHTIENATDRLTLLQKNHFTVFL